MRLFSFFSLYLISAISSLAPPVHSYATESTLPNILLLMSDDLTKTLGCYGHPLAKTPRCTTLH